MSESTLQIKTRLMRLGLKQVDLLEPLRMQGFSSLNPSFLSRIINGRTVGPTPEAVLGTIEQILNEKERRTT